MNKQFWQALEGNFAGNTLPVLTGHADAARRAPTRRSERVFEAAVESDAAYFERRAGEERAAANSAGSAVTRTLHLDLAGRYACLSVAIREAEAQLG